MLHYECTVQSCSYPSTWSSEEFGSNFQEAYRTFDVDTIRSKLGSTQLNSRDISYGDRFVSWESIEGVVCLRDISLTTTLTDNAVCLRFGASPIMEINVASNNQRDNGCTTISVVQQDCTVHVLVLQSLEPNSSFLEQLVHADEGRTVNFGGMISTEMAHIGLSKSHNHKETTYTLAGALKRKLRYYCSQVRSVPTDRDVVSASWASHNLLLLGLSQGDTLAVNLTMPDIGHSLQLSENLLKDRTVGLHALISGFLGASTAPDGNGDTIAIAAASSTALSLNRSGTLRVWSLYSRQLVTQVGLYELLDAVGEAGFFQQSSASYAAMKTADQPRSVMLQDCVVRMCEDEKASSKAARYLIAALAVLPEENALNGKVVSSQALRAQFGPAVGLVTDSIPLHQQAWQVLLFAWKESTDPSNAALEKPKLVAQPIRFPFGSLCGAPGSRYIYRSASLVDVHVMVDHERAVAVLTTCWRAEAVAEGAAAAEESLPSIILEGVMGRSEVPLADLRAQGYAPPGPTGEGPGQLSDLVTAGAMTLVCQSAAIDAVQLRETDAIIQKQLATAVASSDAHMDSSNSIKTSMLQRIFLSRRFSTKVICSAYSSFNAKLQRSTTGGVGNEERHKTLDKHTAFTALPQLVVELCEAHASQRMAAASAAGALVARAEGRSGGIQGSQEQPAQQQYQHLLLDSYVAFLSECDNCYRLQARLNSGAVSCSKQVAFVSQRDNDYSVIFPVNSATIGSSELTPRCSLTNQLWDLMEEYTSSSSAVAGMTECFAEFDCIMEQFISQGSFSPSSGSWVPQYFSSLTPVLRDLVPHLPVINHSACLEQLLGVLDPLSEWQQFASHVMLRQSSSSPSSHQVGKEVGASAVVRVFLAEIRARVRKCKIVLTLLSLYSDCIQDRLGHDVAVALRDDYIPAAVKQLFHYSTLLWLDTRRPTDNRMLRYEVELAGLMPLSISGCHVTSADEFAADFDPRCSVLEGFIRHQLTTAVGAEPHSGFLNPVAHAQQAICSSQPSPNSDLCTYLFQTGQYACLARWGSVFVMGVDHSITLSRDLCCCDAEDDQTSLHILSAMGAFSSRITVLTCELMEILRTQWYSLRMRGKSASTRSSRVERAVTSKARELLTAVQQLADSGKVLSRDFWERRPMSSPCTSPLQSSANTNQCHLEAQRAVAGLSCFLASESRYLIACGVVGFCTAREASALRLKVDGAMSLLNALNCVGRDPLRYSSLAALWGRSAEGKGEKGDVAAIAKHLLCRQSAELGSILSLAGIADVLEMFDRALPLLPRSTGAALGQEGALVLVETISSMVDGMGQDSLVSVGVDRNILTELHGAWSRVFEYALLHNSRYNDALDALLRVAELEEQRLIDLPSSFSSAGLSWRDALRALVAQACESGALGWLCGIPEQQLQGYAKEGISLGAAIASTLRTLAATLEMPSATAAVNYYECLFVFQLSRRNYHDAAQAMQLLFTRSQEFATAGSVSPQILTQQINSLAAAVTALAVLPEDQAFLLRRDQGKSVYSSSTLSSPVQPSPVICVDGESLSLCFADKLATRSLALSGASSAELSNPLQRTLALCNRGRIEEAISVARNYDTATSSPLSREKESTHLALVLAALAKTCLESEHVDGGDLFAQVECERFLRAPYRFRTPPNPTSATSASSAKSQWRALIQILQTLQLESSKSTHNNNSSSSSSCKYFEVVVRALLALHRKYSNDPQSPQPPIFLPQPLVDAMCEFPRATDSAGENMPSSSSAASTEWSRWGARTTVLLELLMEFGSLSEACHLARRLLVLVNEEFNHSSADQVFAESTKFWMPYCTFDQLISRCRQHMHVEGAECGAPTAAAFSSFENALSKHFTLLLTSN